MSRERFFRKLAEQLQSIRLSCSAFDVGQEHEAYRLAVSLRVLFYNKPGSPSLMAHLKMTDTILLSSDGGHNDWRGYVAIILDLASPTPVSSRPKLGDKFFPMPLYKWWDEQVIHHHEGREYHRRKLILSAAHKDGGAHVDEKLERFYKDLASGMNGLSLDGRNLVYPNGAPYDQTAQQRSRNTHLAMIRQFAHEVLMTASHYQWLAHLQQSKA
jgi:hypothetical protein